MLKKKLTISLFVVLLLFSVSGTVFATELNSEAGGDLIASQEAVVAAQNYNYNSQPLEAISTEAGAWKYNFNATQTKADLAAAKHSYDQSQFDNSEGGIDSPSSSTACPC
jgi:hypothetical protein